MEANLTFNDMPSTLAYIVKKVDHLETLLEARLSISSNIKDANTWLNLQQLRDYHPDHPAPTTIYSWVRKGTIPYYKKGKKLSFKKSEIDTWLSEGRQKTDAEYETDAINYINRRRTQR